MEHFTFCFFSEVFFTGKCKKTVYYKLTMFKQNENHICFCYRFATWLLANLIEGAFMKQLCQIKENFTAVPNLILLDKNLTEKEKILYLYLLSKQTKKDAKD